MWTTGSFQVWNFYIWIICIVNESNFTTTKSCFRICAFRLSALFKLFQLLRKSLPWLVTLTTLISWTMSWLYAAYHKSGFNFKNLKPEFEFFFRKKNNKKNLGFFRKFSFLKDFFRILQIPPSKDEKTRQGGGICS